MLHRYSLTTECMGPTEIANPFGIRDSSVWIVKGGGSPPSHFAPGHAGSEQSSLPSVFLRMAVRV